MRYRVVHTTTYTSTYPVSIAHNKAWLEPRPTPNQYLHRFDLKITPTPSVRSRLLDPFGNPVWMFSFNEGYGQLDITSTSVIDVAGGRTSAEPISGPSWNAVVEQLSSPDTDDVLEAVQFRYPSPGVLWTSALRDYAETSFPPDRCLREGLQDLTARIHADFRYDPRATTINTGVLEVLENRRGVCQDFAHLQIALLRSLGLAARYVSGYIRTHPPKGRPRLIGADASHAWISVYAGRLGWIDADPTNNVLPDAEHITVAWGRDYFDVHPLAGVCVGGTGHRLRVSVDVDACAD